MNPMRRTKGPLTPHIGTLPLLYSAEFEFELDIQAARTQQGFIFNVALQNVMPLNMNHVHVHVLDLLEFSIYIYILSS